MHLTPKTLYISDLDGTLLNQSAKLSDHTVNSLNSLIEKGLYFSVATARLLPPVQKMLNQVQLNIPIILMNGVLIYDTIKKKYVKINKLQTETANLIFETIRKFEITSFMCELHDDVLFTYHETFDKEPLHEYIKERISRYTKDFNHSKGFVPKSNEDIIYFTLIDSKEHLQPVYDVFVQNTSLNQTLYKNVYCPDLWYLEIYSSQASKQNAVTYLRKTLGIEHVVGFGDNHNDVSLFESCDVRVAVENATSDIKSLADYICDTNENDGVIKWLEEHFVADI